jgi:putative oxidoreductase
MSLGHSLQVVNGFGWTWNTGGYEYPVFWALTSLAVAIEARKAHLQQASRLVGAARSKAAA